MAGDNLIPLEFAVSAKNLTLKTRLFTDIDSGKTQKMIVFSNN